MSYSLTLTNGTSLVTLTGGINNSATSINLIGPNATGYGYGLNENFIKILENFSNTTAPNNPLKGQLWFDSSTGNVILKNYNGTTWKAIANSNTSSTAPANPQNGDYWWNTSNSQLSVYNGSSWVAVGPYISVGSAVTAFTANTSLDSSTQPHIVANLLVNNKLSGIMSSDASAYTLQTSVSGITSVNPGLNLISGLTVYGASVFSGNVSFTGNVTLPPSFQANLSYISGNVSPSANLTYNLGSPTAYWNNVYGTAVHAQYADLAERFEADVAYDPGTVVEIGGEAEITAASTDLSEEVFGVISTNAAYLMNSGAGTDLTHPPVAVQGRVPVKVIGKISKGDRLVSAGNGFARAGKKSEITTWNVIGRALENKTTLGEGIIEAVVKLNS